MKKKKSPNFARSEVIHVLTKKSVALIDNNIAKNSESRPIIALVEIIIIITYALEQFSEVDVYS